MCSVRIITTHASMPKYLAKVFNSPSHGNGQIKTDFWSFSKPRRFITVANASLFFLRTSGISNIIILHLLSQTSGRGSRIVVIAFLFKKSLPNLDSENSIEPSAEVWTVTYPRLFAYENVFCSWLLLIFCRESN